MLAFNVYSTHLQFWGNEKPLPPTTFNKRPNNYELDTGVIAFYVCGKLF